ncbi:MAG: hypothetical protein ABI831_12120 [Betaproteobacteria bacterium]
MIQGFWTGHVAKPVGSLLTLAALLLLSACGGGGSGGTSPNTPTGALTISPTAIATEFGVAPITFVVSGGVKPYSLTSSLQSLIPVTNSIAEDGRFNITPAYAPDIVTVVTLTVRDGAQGVVTATVTVSARLGVVLAVSPTTVETGINVPVTFTISGGSTPYTVSSSQPAIIPNPIVPDAQGRFTVTPISNPTVSTPVVLTIRDARNATVTATVTVRSLALAVSPTTATTTLGVPVSYQISGGQGPYTVLSSFQSIVPNPVVDANGRFTATPIVSPPTSVDVTLVVRDASGTQVTSILTITPIPFSVSPTTVSVPVNVPVTFTITGGTAPYTVVSSQPSLVPNPASIDAQGRFTLRAIAAPAAATAVLITIRDAANNVTTVTMTITSTALSVLPATAIVYANTPTTLTIYGGLPPYQAFSTNSAVLPVARNVVGDQIVLTAANVDVETTVTITIVDSAGTSVSAVITVKPAPLLNTLTITPTPASPGVGCGSAVCAGQTASVSVLVRNVAGAGLQGRSVRFENVQGDYQFLTNAPGLPETLANSITVTTGQDGLAIVRLKANVNAPTQVALIRATELATGNILNASFIIAQFTDGAGTLTAIPTSWNLTGPNSSTCAANIPVTYYIFGGTPPYRIQSTAPNFANIIPTLVQTNGGGFTAIVTGSVCSPSPGVSFTITDATGRTISVSLINAVGSGNPATNFRQIQFSPSVVTNPVGCGQSIVEQIVGGEIVLADGTITQPTFVVSTLGPNVTVTLNGRALTISRTPTGSAISPAIVYVSNGVSLESLAVPVAQTCGAPATPVEFLQFAPSSPLVVGCAIGASSTTTITPILAPGNTPIFTYTGTVFSGLSVSFASNVMTVTRTAAVLAGSSSIPIIVLGTEVPPLVDPPNVRTVTGTLYVAPPLACP